MNVTLILYIVIIFLIVAALIALGTIWFCMQAAKKVLHPMSKRKPLDRWPDQEGIPYENVTFKTTDHVQLKGWFITSPQESNKTIIFMHDWGMNRSDVFKKTYFLRDLGFNLFYFDFRALGESGGKTSSVGYLELRDVKAALSFLKETRPQFCEKIGFYGLSLGGAVALCEAAQNPEIACVVAEASYYSLRRIVSRWAWMRYHIPSFPLLPLILKYIRKNLGVNPESYSPKYNIGKIAPRPIFLIHGRYDNLIPAAQAKLLYKAAADPKEIWLVPGAKHNQCAEVGGFEYKQKIADFYRKYL